MSYYILSNVQTGELIQISSTQEGMVAGENEIIKYRNGDIPDLTKYEWHPGSLSFIEKSKDNVITKLAFMRKFTDDELERIYTLSKTNIKLEIWLDKFKVAEEINLEDIDIINGLTSFESLGILASGRANEIFGGIN